MFPKMVDIVLEPIFFIIKVGITFAKKYVLILEISHEMLYQHLLIIIGIIIMCMCSSCYD